MKLYEEKGTWMESHNSHPCNIAFQNFALFPMCLCYQTEKMLKENFLKNFKKKNSEVVASFRLKFGS